LTQWVSTDSRNMDCGKSLLASLLDPVTTNSSTNALDGTANSRERGRVVCGGRVHS
jgi:hypothetical protein